MDKKVVYGIVDSMVKTIVESQQIEEAEARALVGISLRKNAAAIVQSASAYCTATVVS